MPETGDPDDAEGISEEFGLSAEQLRGLQWGVAATIMPVQRGWRIHYFSIPTFEEEPGTDFPSFDVAIAAVIETIPAINSHEKRARALAEFRTRLRRPSGGHAADDAVT